MFKQMVGKRMIVIALVLTLLSSILGCAMASSEQTEGNFRFKILSDGTAEITKYTGYDTVEMVIPEQLDGHVVTSIGKNAFMYAPLSTLTIGNTVTKIGDAAFFGCDAKTVSICSDTIVIGEKAFSCCSDIESFSLAANNVEIGEAAFMYTEPLTHFEWSLADDNAQNTKTIIGETAFFSSGIVDITIPGDDLTIGKKAFSCCSSIKSMTALCKTVNIGNSAFMYAEFESFTLPNTSVGEATMKIDENAFFSCGLHKFTIPACISKIGNKAFSCSSDLKEVVIPPTVTSIGKGAFQFCDSSLIAKVVEGSYADQYCKKNKITSEYITEDHLTTLYGDGYVEDATKAQETASAAEKAIDRPKNATPSSQRHSEYTYMYDKWNLYKATFISDSALKIERWNRWNAGEDGDPFAYEYDVCVVNIADGSTDFMWVDQEQTAFTITLADEKNSSLDDSTIVGFAVDTDEIGGAIEYSFMNDKWDLYKAYALSETAIKVEKWSRFDASEDGDPFAHDSDICVIQVGNASTDFEWTDDSHNAFTITMIDDNNGYWDDEKNVPFAIATDPETMQWYSYQNDKWDLYKAFRLSETTIKVERWTRFDAGVDGDPFRCENDVCVIKTTEDALDFAWGDEHQTAFTITLKDEENSYWDDEICVPFGIESAQESYRRYTYQNDKWDMYVATMLSDSIIKIEDWTRFDASEGGDPFRREHDVMIVDVEDGSSQFVWVDDAHSAFRVFMEDNKNSYWDGAQEVTFVFDDSFGIPSNEDTAVDEKHETSVSDGVQDDTNEEPTQGDVTNQPSSSAEEWDCPECGNRATGNFCNNCGTPKPSQEPEEQKDKDDNNEASSEEDAPGDDVVLHLSFKDPITDTLIQANEVAVSASRYEELIEYSSELPAEFSEIASTINDYVYDIELGTFWLIEDYDHADISIYMFSKEFLRETYGEETVAKYDHDEEPEMTTEEDPQKSAETNVDLEPNENSEDPNSDPLVVVQIGSETVQVHKSFKDAMDSYEAFFDDYIDFMKNPDLSGYAEFMAKYSETMDSFDDYTDNDLSSAEMAYYMDVYGRIMAKISLAG